MNIPGVQTHEIKANVANTNVSALLDMLTKRSPVEATMTWRGHQGRSFDFPATLLGVVCVDDQYLLPYLAEPLPDAKLRRLLGGPETLPKQAILDDKYGFGVLYLTNQEKVGYAGARVAFVDPAASTIDVCDDTLNARTLRKVIADLVYPEIQPAIQSDQFTLALPNIPDFGLGMIHDPILSPSA